MYKLLFFILFIFIFILRTALAPIFIVIKNIIPFINKRINFERKNIFNEKSVSFRKSGLKADYLFHVSSEGELEQSLPIIRFFLNKNMLLELVYTSESVEKKIDKLYQSYPNSLRVYRLPLLSFFPFDFLYFQSIFSFVTANKIILCRYDFFPELLFFHYLNKKLILTSAATKNWSRYKTYCFLFFDYIVSSSEIEKEQILQITQKKSSSFDFRIPQILDRKKNIPNLALNRLEFAQLTSCIKSENEEIILFGSMWPSDCLIFNNEEFISKLRNNKMRILVAPHKLDLESIEELTNVLKKITNIEIAQFGVSSKKFDAPIVLVTIPGILCELYNYFPLVYVGGGFERSIHSVLEPYLMGAKVIVGQLIHRSTEFDFVKSFSPKEIKVLKNPDSFYNLFRELKDTESDKDIRRRISNESEEMFKNIISEIELL
jgi:3-deoxy-D-manno-octulosonic-acid transferase